MRDGLQVILQKFTCFAIDIINPASMRLDWIADQKSGTILRLPHVGYFWGSATLKGRTVA
ncbi:hypothetical protein ABZ318_27080 [Streptomyces sp. NPDC006197]|uniref:hypothetical protein n=1 Tax=Streptomyces sp. NPDC006197 TaxID=3156685 RepID=UPI0033B38CC3